MAYITEGTIKEIDVNTSKKRGVLILIDPSQVFKFEYEGEAGILLVPDNYKNGLSGSNKKYSTMLCPIKQDFKINNVSIAELIILKNNRNVVRLHLKDDLSVERLKIV